MNRNTFIAVAGVVLVAGAWYWGTSLEKTSPVAKAPAGEEAHWMERIKEEGSAAAYAEFGKSVAAESPQLQHAGAHFFGAALYAAAGTAGLSTCDAQFNFGCYHEFLGRAIATEGLSTVLSLNDACFTALTESPLSCQHGIGHGVISYLGYNEKALLKSLKECRDLPHADPIGGCYGGVFMEYNMQTMLATEARLRPLGDNPLEPCDTLDAEYKPACYYWQPQWWAQMIRPGLVGAAAFTKMGSWCQRTGTHKKDCFEGMGNIASPESDFLPDKARTLCEAASTDWRDQLYCKSVAANSLALGGGGKKADGMKVCEGLSGTAMTYCASYAKNESNVVNRGVLQGE